MISTILFDLDGTLIDSEPMALKAITDCTHQWGVPVTHAQAAEVAGKKWEIAFDLLYQKFQMPLSREEASKAIVAQYQHLVRSEVPLVPGGAEAVAALAGAGYSMALVSGSIRDDIFWALRHLKIEKYFHLVLGAEDYRESKPSPEGYLKAMKHFGVRGSDCLVFEDSFPGITSGKSAGAYVVAIESTNHLGHDQSAADLRIKDLREVNSDWVKANFKRS